MLLYSSGALPKGGWGLLMHATMVVHSQWPVGLSRACHSIGSFPETGEDDQVTLWWWCTSHICEGLASVHSVSGNLPKGGQ